MGILKYLEKAWILAAIVSFVVMIYNAITIRVFDQHIYFPMFCGLFCILIWHNIRGQRRFREKAFNESKNKQNGKA